MSCTTEESADLAPLVSLASEASLYSDALRRALIEAMANVSAACTTCVLATFISVCDTCIRDAMHVVTDYEILASACLPELAAGLKLSLATTLRSALASREPFGLTAVRLPSGVLPTDWFMPTSENMNGLPVYAGVDSGTWAMSCSTETAPIAWAILATDDRDRWAKCDAEMFVDLQTGVVSTGSEGNDVVPASFHVGSWAGCLPGIVIMDLDTSDGVLSFPVGTSTSEVECWLGRRFGPQSRVVNPDRLHVSFPGRLPNLRMRSDIVVPAGMNLTINGHGTTINVDRWQIRVPKGATLALENVVLASSTQSCALWIEGFAELTEVHFQNCTVEGLVVLREFSSLAFDGGAYVWSAGGAVHIWADGGFSMTASSVRDCVAQNGRADCSAGAILIGKRAVVTIVDSVFENNSAVSSRPLANAIGGAIRIQKSAVMTMRGCMLLSNKVVLTASEAAKLGAIAALAEVGTAQTTGSVDNGHRSAERLHSARQCSRMERRPQGRSCVFVDSCRSRDGELLGGG